MLTKKDQVILDLLKNNAKLSTREISEKTGISMTTVHNRIKRLEKDGVIRGYKAIVDKKKLGLTIKAIVQISVHGKYLFENDLAQEDLGKKIISMPEVEECFMVTGESDIVLLVSAKDMDELNDFITNKLRKVGGVEKTVTSVVMKDIKNHSSAKP